MSIILKSYIVSALLISVFIGGSLLVSVYAQTVTPQVIVGNAAPVVSAVNISPDPILLTGEGTTTTITVTSTITDSNGCAEVFDNGTTTGVLYRSGVGASCSADDNNCYIFTLTEISDTCTGGADTTGDAIGTIEVWYFAEATDASSSFSGENWDAQVKAIDSSNASSTDTDGGTELNTLLALSVTASINYGTVSANATSTTQTATTTNTGNFNDMDTEFSGSNTLDSGANTIATDQQKYSTTTSENYTDLDFTLTSTTVRRATSIVKSTSQGSSSTQNTFWAILIPAGQAAGTYTGTTTFTVQ